MSPTKMLDKNEEQALDSASGAGDQPDPTARLKPFARSTKYRIHLNDLGHESVAPFVQLIDVPRILNDATNNVLKHLYAQHGKPPPVRSVTLILEDMGGVAYTEGLSLDNMHKQIHLSLAHIGNNIKQPLAFRAETIGVITHEMVHCWQHNARGSAPGGLIEGIADFVRLKSGLSPPHWKKSKDQAGKKWDEGYQKTAWFLEWLEEQKGKGTVGKINDRLDDRQYEEKSFWDELFGESVEDLWKKYMAHWDEQESLARQGQSRVISPIGSEAEMVELTDEEKLEATNLVRNAHPFKS